MKDRQSKRGTEQAQDRAAKLAKCDFGIQSNPRATPSAVFLS